MTERILESARRRAIEANFPFVFLQGHVRHSRQATWRTGLLLDHLDGRTLQEEGCCYPLSLAQGVAGQSSYGHPGGVVCWPLLKRGNGSSQEGVGRKPTYSFGLIFHSYSEGMGRVLSLEAEGGLVNPCPAKAQAA